MWRDMKLDPPPGRDAPDFIALGNTELALVWWELEAGSTWMVMNLPGRGVRLGGRDLSLTFHSWCPVGEMHRAMNIERNPAYYGKS